MRFDVEANGHRHVVEAHRAGNLWRVTCNGREMTADLGRVGHRLSLLIGPPEGGPHTFKSYEVSLEARGRTGRVVHLDGQLVQVLLVDPLAAFTRRGDSSGVAHTGVMPVAATMPGRVVKVLVKAGERVAARQGLVIVEAMKMENEIRSPRAGIVRDVRVAAGASIEAGTLMVVIE